MPTRVQLRRGTTTEHSTFTGADGEVTVDTTKNTAVVHNGSTAGGFPLLKEAAIGASVQAYDAATAKTNTAQTFTAAQSGAISALGNQSGTITINFSTSNNFSLTLNANSSNTLATPSNITAGQSGIVIINQDSTGSRLLSFSSAWKWVSGTTPSLTTTASATDVIAYFCDSTSRITARFLADVK